MSFSLTYYWAYSIQVNQITYSMLCAWLVISFKYRAWKCLILHKLPQVTWLTWMIGCMQEHEKEWHCLWLELYYVFLFPYQGKEVSRKLSTRQPWNISFYIRMHQIWGIWGMTTMTALYSVLVCVHVWYVHYSTSVCTCVLCTLQYKCVYMCDTLWYQCVQYLFIVWLNILCSCKICGFRSTHKIVFDMYLPDDPLGHTCQFYTHIRTCFYVWLVS